MLVMRSKNTIFMNKVGFMGKKMLIKSKKPSRKINIIKIISSSNSNLRFMIFL